MISFPPYAQVRSRRTSWLLALVASAVASCGAFAAAQLVDPAALPPTRGEAPSFRDLLVWSDIPPQSLGEIPSTYPTDDADRRVIEQVLFRLSRAEPALLEVAIQWEDSASEEASPQLGEIIELHGRVVQVDRIQEREPDGGVPSIFRCVMRLPSASDSAVIWANRVPAAWLSVEGLNERASVRGAFAGARPNDGSSQTLVALADRVAWHPDDEGTVGMTLGRRVLGELSVDVGRLDEVRHRTPLTRQDREAFYRMLDAVDRTDPRVLLKNAARGLESYVQPWREEQTAGSRSRRLLAKAVIDSASEGRYSVAPLFLDAENQTGELILLEGVARRAIGIETDGEVDSYFELEIFTPDSQNLPVVCCVPSLPAGFPRGDAIREPVVVAGFFFKLWRYDSRVPRNSQEGPLEFEPTAAPLIIAAEPRWPRSEPAAGSELLAWITAGIILVALGVLTCLAWWWSRADRRLRRRRLPSRL